ncbi:Sec63 Brl domain-containing protein [Flammula alnicola]|nr:Sec63 Brl domain-containing protein [Flammula alnicola]
MDKETTRRGRQPGKGLYATETGLTGRHILIASAILTLYIKGAPERVLSKCTTYLKDGQMVSITDQFKEEYDEATDDQYPGDHPKMAEAIVRKINLLLMPGRAGRPQLADNLNAEIVLVTYGAGADYPEDDDGLIQKRANIAHFAAVLLEKCQLIKYERTTDRFTSTELGRIASYYYTVFAFEFKVLPVRQDEKARLLERVPIPVRETVEEPAAKINVLLQAYISQLKLEGSVLIADVVFMQQSAGCILRMIFKICLKCGWAVPAKAALDLCKMVDTRKWGPMTRLRQFKGVPPEPWYRDFDLTLPESGALIGIPNAGALPGS